MEKDIISENLRRLKKYKSLTQEKLAKEAGISLSAYRNIENARSLPRIDTLIAISRALDVDLRQVVAPVKKLKAVRFRAKKKMNSRQQILADVGRWLTDFNQLEEMLADRIDFKLAQFSSSLPQKSDIVSASAHCRQRLDLKPEEPIQDICGLLESAGVKMFPYRLMSHDFFGLSVAANDGGPAIVVNTYERIPVERWIFSAAHELAHLLFHLESFDVAQTEENDEQEKEADIFAAHFLMPQDAFIKKWEETAGIHPVDRILKVKRYFKVSYKTVIHRLNETIEGKVNLYKWFYAEYKLRYGKSLVDHTEPSSQPPAVFSASLAESMSAKEPENLSRIDFIETRLDRLVRRGIEEEKISLSRGAEILNLSLEDMRQLANSWVVYT